MSGFRLDSGGLIDRRRVMDFHFNGKLLSGFAGDTLASALLAAGFSTVGRSFKYHRRRGIVGAGFAETNALVQLENGAFATPNALATQIELYHGLRARSVNAWPSINFDVGAVNDLLANFLIAGFYYKTFTWPRWEFFEPFIRRVAGLGRAPELADGSFYEARSAHCDVLVVGGGPAGLMAAEAAADAGADVILLESDQTWGGHLVWEGARLEDLAGVEWAASIGESLAGRARLLNRTTALAYHENNLVVAIEQVHDEPREGLRERLWRIRARQIVLATGSIERSLIFPDNDRPGIMLADAVLCYLRRFAVAPGRRMVLYTATDSGYETAVAAAAAGLSVEAIADVRDNPPSSALEAARKLGLEVIAGAAVRSVIGRSRVREVEFVSDGKRQRIPCDLLAVSGGWTPTVHLFSQSGGRLRYHSGCGAFVPDVPAQATHSCGAAAASFSLREAITEGWDTGAAAATACGYRVALSCPISGERFSRASTEAPPVPMPSKASMKSCFVDLQTDVTLFDLQLSLQENYRSIEHVKRYTTLGMGTDQGKLANVNAIGMLAQMAGVSPADIGTTRFRPVFQPASLSGASAGRQHGDLFKPRRYLPAHAWHAANRAVFEDYRWERPSHYPLDGESLERAAQREALNVRQHVGLFDGSPLGKFEVKGPEAGLFLDRLYVGSPSKLRVGRIRYDLMLNENGTIVEDGVVARLGPDRFLLNSTSGGADRTFGWIEEVRQCQWPLDFVIQNVTSQWAVLTLAGPRARDVLHAVGIDVDLAAETFPHLHFREGRVAGVPARIQRVSFSGELGYEINIPAGYASDLAALIQARGAPFGLMPYGIEALEILRTEKGYIHVGADTDSNTQPSDIGMGAAMAKKQSDFIGRRSLMRPASTRRGRLQLVGLRAEGAIVLPSGSHVRGGGAGPSDGFVTSSYFSPSLGRGVALALVRDGRSRQGESVTLWSEGRTWQATIAEPAAYDSIGEKLRA